MTLKERVSLAASAWRDSEFWDSFKGLGCALCQVNPPIIWGLSFGALCDRCLERCLPGWAFDRIVEWLGRQRLAFLRKAERQAVFQAARENDLGPALEYERKYGVWLLDRPRP